VFASILPRVSKSLGICICLVFGFLANPSRTDAGFQAKLGSVSPYVQVNVSNTDSANAFSFNGVLAVEQNWAATTAVSGLTTGSTNAFETFCIEIPQDVYIGSTYNFAKTPLSNLPT
jgi:hypothetical protein